MAEPANNVSMIKPPSTAHSAEFAAGFGQRVLLTVDTEEEFNWNAPFTRDQHGLEHIAAIVRFQRFCEEIGAHPVYLVDWPVANDDHAVEIIGDAVMRGKAEIGVQLHPWVNPPYDEDVTAQNSYAGNLPRELERPHKAHRALPCCQTGLREMLEVQNVSSNLDSNKSFSNMTLVILLLNMMIA